jgi:Ca2+-binding RTX toxin-like protein
VLFDGADETSETFTVVLSNPANAALGTATGTATITNDAPNQPPVAADDVVLLAPGQPFADVNVLSNDTDADGDVLVASVAAAPAHGTAAVNADGTIRYTPAAGFSGGDSFTYTASDGRGGTTTATVNLTVTGNAAVADPSNPKKTNLFLAGTSGNDTFQFVKVKKQYKVLLNGQDQGTFTVNGRVTISGGDGDDSLTLGKLKLPVVFNGGDGNDMLIASGKGSILVGGAGNDTLKGGAGRDVIIGSDGADTIDGVGGNDLIIAGPTIYDADTLANRQALDDLLAEISKGGKYATKLTNLAAGVGSSGAKIVANVTAFNDGDADNITGGGGQDIYVARTATTVMDTLTKKAKNESVIEL